MPIWCEKCQSTHGKYDSCKVRKRSRVPTEAQKAASLRNWDLMRVRGAIALLEHLEHKYSKANAAAGAADLNTALLSLKVFEFKQFPSKSKKEKCDG